LELIARAPGYGERGPEGRGPSQSEGGKMKGR
jgi:hypothetical protein